MFEASVAGAGRTVGDGAEVDGGRGQVRGRVTHGGPLAVPPGETGGWGRPEPRHLTYASAATPGAAFRAGGGPRGK